MPILLVLLALDGTQITLGVFGIVTVLITALVAPLMLSNRSRVKTVEQKAEQAEWNAAVVHHALEEKIGTPNGRGNVVRMLETLQDELRHHEEALSKRLDLMDKRDEATMALITEHLKRYDRDHGPHARQPPPCD